MELVELVTQGLLGAPDATRVAFAPGVTLLPATTKEQLYVRIVLDLLYPKSTEPTLADLDDPNGQSRVGIVVQGRDNTRYRLLLDVKSGRRALLKIGADNTTQPVTNSANEIAQSVTATIGFPQEDVMRELFFARKEDLPSRRARAKAAQQQAQQQQQQAQPAASLSRKPLPPGFEESVSTVRRRSEEASRARIAEIDDILNQYAAVKDLEFELDGLQKKLFDLETKLKPLTTLRRSVSQAEDRLKQFAGLERVPADIVEKGERLKATRSAHERDLKKLDDDRERLASQLPAPTAKLTRPAFFDAARGDVLVQGGMAAGGLAVVLAVVGAFTWEPLRWAAFLDIPAFAVALLGGLRVLGVLEEGERGKRLLERVDAERARVKDKLKDDEQALHQLLDKVGFKLDDLPAVEQELKNREEARGLVEKTRAALDEALTDPELQNIENEQKEVSTRAKALEEKLAAAGAGFSGIGDLEMERDELQRMLAGGPEPAPQPAAVVEKPEISEIRGPAEDLGQRLLALASDALMISLEDTVEQVRGRANQVTLGLSDGRYREVTYGGRGEVSVVDGSGESIIFGALPGIDRDVVWLALKIALIEQVVKVRRLPVIFDRSLDFLVDNKAQMLTKMLQFLAASTQVVSISTRPELGGRAQ